MFRRLKSGSHYHPGFERYFYLDFFREGLKKSHPRLARLLVLQVLHRLRASRRPAALFSPLSLPARAAASRKLLAPNVLFSQHLAHACKYSS